MTQRIQNIIKINLVLLFAIVWQSCTEKMDIKLDSTYTRCVIYGEITTDTAAHKVRITRSANYFSNKPSEPISGAVVTITDGVNIYQLTESLSEPGNYYTNSDVCGLPGKTYTLNVSNVDLLGDGVLSSYSASSELKPVAKIDSINTQYNSHWEIWEVKAWTKDPEETKDFYMFKTYINGVLYADSLINLGFSDDLFFNGSNINGATVYRIFEKDTIKAGYNITLNICGINEDYFKFIFEAQTAIFGQSPMFSGPPANIRTNLSNNAVGYFSAYSIASSSNTVK